MMDDQTIERVALALFKAEQPNGEPFNNFRWQHTAANYRLLARAAIAELEVRPPVHPGNKS
jgi:hypothetical protein